MFQPAAPEFFSSQLRLIMLVFPTMMWAPRGNGLLNDLIGHWQCDSTADDHTNSLTLTDNNTVQVGTGKVNANCGDFERANGEFFSHASDALLHTGDIDFSYAAWVQLESKPAGQMVISSHFDTNEVETLFDYHTTNDRFRLTTSQDGGLGNLDEVSADTFGSPSLATWYYVACGHSATNNELWISVNDGTVDTVAATSGVYTGTSVFKIGTRDTTRYWDGLIENFNFWKTDIRGAKLTALYNGGSGLAFANYTT